eukprot:TRINITY_DN10978_c0_g1_i1.p2 TRINITY_DN10978_c0_g1~~TRINITY_DN10978_c0_g1_i1.p2  ORF type:complete len:134 (+),score=27.72 TRINITY_DN10978_c0_g1_i1:63-464(+)
MRVVDAVLAIAAALSSSGALGGYVVSAKQEEDAPLIADVTDSRAAPDGNKGDNIIHKYREIYNEVDKINAALKLGSQQTLGLATGDATMVPMMTQLAKKIMVDAKSIAAQASIIGVDTPCGKGHRGVAQDAIM